MAAAAWEALWPSDLRLRYALYRFGLEKLVRLEEGRMRHFFHTFFHLPDAQWYGCLTNTLPLPQLVVAMLRFLRTAPGDVRWGLMEPKGRVVTLLGRMLGG